MKLNIRKIQLNDNLRIVELTKLTENEQSLINEIHSLYIQEKIISDSFYEQTEKHLIEKFGKRYVSWDYSRIGKEEIGTNWPFSFFIDLK